MRQKISKSAVDRLQPGKIIADNNPVGFVARRLASGVLTYGYRYRHKETGKQHWVGLGLGTELAPDQARHRALKLAAQVKDGGTPVSAARVVSRRRQAVGVTVDRVLDEFLARYAVNLRSRDEIERAFRVYVRPRLGGKLDSTISAASTWLNYWTPSRTAARRSWPTVCSRICAKPCAGTPAATKISWCRSFPVSRGRARRSFRTRVLGRPGNPRSLCRARRSRRRGARLLPGICAHAVPDRDTAYAWFPIWHGARSRVAIGRCRERATRAGASMSCRSPMRWSALLGERRKGFVFSSDGGKTAFEGFSKAKAALDAKLAGIRKTAGRKPMPILRFTTCGEPHGL